MKEFQLSFEKREKYLFIKGKGERSNLQEILDSTRAFAKVVEQTGSTFLLVDYTETRTQLSNNDIFNITRLYETQTPVLQKLCLSIIIPKDELSSEKFWEDICSQRGFNFKIFVDKMMAEQWLLLQIRN
ncbi:MAG: hypothetical protein HOP08_19320 [Cyclobacteriaceae bacterium]|nr:hypothetical protein [Cyclobacteriaceae bacterium]